MIGAGRVLESSKVLELQGIKNNHQMMALVLDSSPTEHADENAVYDRVKSVKSDAELLIGGKQSMMHMEDQSGNGIYLPPDEKKKLMLALALHEKGRTELNKDKFSEAIVFFLEADSEFNKCDQKWLDAVDNYALLNLDIVWCYLCLKSVTHLPDAERRLALCAENFRKSYGENMNRVVALKGSSGNEQALVMRLHLLQAVVYFHQNRRTEAHEMLSIADSELRRLKIDERSLNLILEMGYTATEARIGLRACHGNVEAAIGHILEKRDERRDARKKADAERRLQSESAALSLSSLSSSSASKTDQWVNPRNLQVLIGMGYQKELCILALKKSNNDISTAINQIEEHKDELIADIKLNPNHLTEMESLGFHMEMSIIALQSTYDNMTAAVDLLLELQSNGRYTTILNELKQIHTDGPSTSSISSADGAVARNEKLLKKLTKEAEQLTAFKRFAEDFNEGEDSHLDLPLEHEEKIINEYKKFLGMNN